MIISTGAKKKKKRVVGKMQYIFLVLKRRSLQTGDWRKRPTFEKVFLPKIYNKRNV